MARCWLADGRCGRTGPTCPPKQCIARTVRKLHDRRWRERLGLFAAEGEDLVASASADPVALLVAGENVEPRLLAEVATAAHPPRVIGVFRREDLPPWTERPVVLALWRVADPGNVGTLVRAADAFGAALALSPGCADPTGPKAVRASAGAIWRVPLRSSNRRARRPMPFRGRRVSRSSRTGGGLSRSSTCAGRSRSSSAPSARGFRTSSSEMSTRTSRSSPSP